MWVLVENFVPGIDAEKRPGFRYFNSTHPDSCVELLQAFENIWDYSSPPESDNELLKKRVDRVREALIGILYDPSFVPTPANLQRLNQIVERGRLVLEESADSKWSNMFADYLGTQRATEISLWPRVAESERETMIKRDRAILALEEIRNSL